MDCVKRQRDLVKFRTETGNAAGMDKDGICYLPSFDPVRAQWLKLSGLTLQAQVIYISNNDSMTQDALVLGHIDVVKAADGMFAPKIEDGRMYGRGTLDVKSFAAVAMNSMHCAGA